MPLPLIPNAGTLGVATSPAWPAWLELIKRLGADANLSGVGISPGWSGKLADANRGYIYGGQFVSTDEIVATGESREETATLDVFIIAAVPGDEAFDAIVRARSYGAVLEQHLAQDPNLSNSVPGFMWAQVAGWTQDYELTDDAIVAALLYKIEFHSYLY